MLLLIFTLSNSAILTWRPITRTFGEVVAIPLASMILNAIVHGVFLGRILFFLSRLRSLKDIPEAASSGTRAFDVRPIPESKFLAKVDLLYAR